MTAPTTTTASTTVVTVPAADTVTFEVDTSTAVTGVSVLAVASLVAFAAALRTRSRRENRATEREYAPELADTRAWLASHGDHTAGAEFAARAGS